MEENISKPRYGKSEWNEFLREAKETQRFSEDSRNREYRIHLTSFMRDYYYEKQELLDSHYEQYKTAISEDFFDEHYMLLDERKMKAVLSQCKVMVITANLIEKAILHLCIINKNPLEKIRRIICGNNIYFVLKWGKYWVAHVPQTETGAYKDFGTNATIYEATKHFTPNVILSLGVAFGIDYKTQSIGDVIVSRRILPYNENKRDEEKIIPDRNQDKKIDNWLHVRFVNASGFLDRVIYGDVLTGESVMSSFAEKDRVCLGYNPTDYVIGGEMEGNALFQYAKTDGIPCAVIKGICDWGVAKNDIFDDDRILEESFKDCLQAFAMSKVIDSCDFLFNDETLFASSKNAEMSRLRYQYKTAMFSLCFTIIIIIALAIPKSWELIISEIVFSSVLLCLALLILVVNLFLFIRVPYKFIKTKMPDE